MKTEFMLLACYEKPLIPLKTFCEDIMGIKLQTPRPARLPTGGRFCYAANRQ